MGENQGQATYGAEMIELIKGMARVEQKLNDLAGVKETAIKAEQSASSAHKRIDGIEDERKWAKRTSVGAIITGGISLLCSVILLFLKGGGQ